MNQDMIPSDFFGGEGLGLFKRSSTCDLSSQKHTQGLNVQREGGEKFLHSSLSWGEGLPLPGTWLLMNLESDVVT